MLRLRLFGGAVLEGIEGPLGGAATQRRRIALLAVLACHPDGISRDRLVGLFWPESSDERARHALAQLLYAIRKDLGEAAIVGSATMLRLDPSALATDVQEFHAALGVADLEQASGLYAGPFLDGFYLKGSPEFERWVDEERGRLADRAAGAVERLARQAAEAGDPGRAVRCWTRLAGLRPLDSRIALALAQAHVAAGDTPAALRAARTHQVLVADQLGVEPDATLSAFIGTLKSTPPPPAPVPAAPVRASSEQEEPSAERPEPPPRGSADPDGRPAGPPVRAASPSRPARRRRRLTGVLAATALVAGGWALFGSSGPLAGRDSANPTWLLLADVENDTGDESFDRTLPLLVASGLRQSSRIWVMPPERVREALARARREPDGRLDETLAREMAVREGVALVAVPAVSRAGDGFDVSLRFVSAGSAEVLEATARHAVDRAAVIDAVDRVVRASRRHLGEPAISVASASIPLPRVTTRSLEALDVYARAGRAFANAQVADARALYEQAVALDSTFATAHAALGGLLYYINSPAEGEVHFAHALAHGEGLDWREAAFLRAGIDEWRGDRSTAITTLRTVLAREPNNWTALYRVAYNQLRGDEPAEAAETLRRLVALDSLDAPSRINLATAEKALGRYPEALEQYARAFALRPELATANNNVNLEHAGAWALGGWPDSAAAVIAPMLDGDVNQRARGLRSMAFLATYVGNYVQALSDLEEAITLHRRGRATVSEVRSRLLLASALRLTGRSADARAQIDTAFSTGRGVNDAGFLFLLGRALAREGDTERANAVLEAIDASRHPGSVTGQAASQGLQGEIRVGQDVPLEGLVHLEQAMRLDSSALTLEGLARASAAAGQVDRALALYAELSHAPQFGWEGQEPWQMARYHMGCIEAARGNEEAAANAFRALLDLWPDASAELVPVRVARAYLHDREREGGTLVATSVGDRVEPDRSLCDRGSG